MAKILIAEDDASMRQFLCAALEKAGHSVTACADGLSALKTLETGCGCPENAEKNTSSSADTNTAQIPISPAPPITYDLLLTDIIMPGLDGIELSEHATRLQPQIKVLFITGFTAVTTDNQAPVMAKPFHLSALISQIDEILMR